MQTKFKVMLSTSKRSALFLATVSTDSAVFEATLSLNSTVFVAKITVSQIYNVFCLFTKL